MSLGQIKLPSPRIDRLSQSCPVLDGFTLKLARIVKGAADFSVILAFTQAIRNSALERPVL